MKKLILLFLLVFVFSKQTYAYRKDFKKYFDVDLEEKLPDIKVLSDEFTQKTEKYNPRYVLSWDMGPQFDRKWAQTITSYGTMEKRIKPAHEDDMFEMINTLPKEYYPYIGPVLHQKKGISEKILNMPGIKETKNKFPTRIAPQLADIEDLEFLSPDLYLLLMPETWPENRKIQEKTNAKKQKIKREKYDPEFFQRVLKNVPDQGYGGAARNNPKSPQDKLRTLQITKTSPLKSADIVSFLNTLDEVKAFGTPQHIVQLSRAGTLLNYWEEKNQKNLPVTGLKDLVNPCQRLALKIKWAGLENEFGKIVSKEGFNLNEWAYTCDKTIKAFRIVNISEAKLTSLIQFRKGTFDFYIKKMSQKWQDRQFSMLDTLDEMYTAPHDDVVEVLKNESGIRDKLKQFGTFFLTSPLPK